MKNQQIRKALTVLFALMLVFVLSIGTAGTAFAGALITVNLTGGDYLLESSDMRINVSGTVRIYSDDPGVSYLNVSIDCAAGAQLTIEDVHIDNFSTASVCPLVFSGTGNTLTIAGVNTLTGTYSEVDIPGEPGVKVEGSAALIIDGTGELNATGRGGSAGIGSNQLQSPGTITIDGGTINAAGADNAAGIGGGNGVGGGTITINGGTITATGGEDAAGIGGGYEGDGGTVNINGGTINATGGLQGAGIGSGEMGTVGTINITGGTVTAVSTTEDGAGIGGGYEASGGTINISGGIIDATGSDDGAGIGAGDYGDGTMVITISGGTVTAQGGYYATGIGTGGEYESSGDMTVNITGGDINATGGNSAAGIGYGNYGDGALTINISGGETYAYGGSQGAGIGAGCSDDDSSNSVINISGGWIYACSNDGAGIGAGAYAEFGTINISGGVVNAFSGNASDIGEGYTGFYGEITGGIYVTENPVIFPMNCNFDYDDLGGNRFVEPALKEGINDVPFGTEVVLKDYNGLDALTWLGDADGYLYSYIPDGTYYYTKDDDAMRTQDFTVDGGTLWPELNFVSVLLSQIDVSEGALAPAFDSSTFDYTVTVGNGIESINITPTAADGDDTITVKGTAVASGAASGEIALSVGENVIEAVVTDGTLASAINTYTVTVTREPVIGPGPDIQGALYDPGSNPLVGWTVVLESTPVTVVTDGLGQFGFTNVTLENHTLTIKDTGGNVVHVYTIQFVEGEPFSWSEENDVITIVITSGTVGVDIQIEVGDATPTNVISITEIVDNPDTGGSDSFAWLWITLAALGLLIGAVFIRKAAENN